MWIMCVCGLMIFIRMSIYHDQKCDQTVNLTHKQPAWALYCQWWQISETVVIWEHTQTPCPQILHVYTHSPRSAHTTCVHMVCVNMNMHTPCAHTHIPHHAHMHALLHPPPPQSIHIFAYDTCSKEVPQIDGNGEAIQSCWSTGNPLSSGAVWKSRWPSWASCPY